MGDEVRFDAKWDFRRKENSFDDSSSDNMDSESSHEPILKKHKPVPEAETSKQAAARGRRKNPEKKTPKGKGKKGQKKPEAENKTSGPRTRIGKGKAEGKKKMKMKTTQQEEPEGESTITSVGTFMETLFDDLKASRENLFDWMISEMSQADEKEKKKRNPVRKKPQQQPQLQPQRRPRSVKKNTKNKNGNVEEEKQKAPEENNTEELTEIGPNAGLMLLRCNEDVGYGRNYFQNNHQEQETVQRKPRGRPPRSLSSESWQRQNSLVLAMPAQNAVPTTPETSVRGKKKTDAETETHKSLNLETLIDPKGSSSLLLPPPPSSSSYFPSTQGLAYNSFDLRPPETQVQDSSQGLRDLNSLLYQTTSYFQEGFSLPFHHGYHYPTQSSSETPVRDNNCNNLFSGLRMSGGAIRLSTGGSFPEQYSGQDVGNSFSDYRTSSGSQTPFQTQNNLGGNSSLFQN